MAKIENASISDLPNIPPVPKKRGRPSTGNAKSNAIRQRNFRASLKTDMYELDDSFWTEKHCLFALGFFPVGSSLHKAAWVRLGVISIYR